MTYEYGTHLYANEIHYQETREALEIVRQLELNLNFTNGKYYYLYGGTIGEPLIKDEGDTPAAAMFDFCTKFFNQKV